MILDVIFKNKFLFNFFSRANYIRGIRHLRTELFVTKYLESHLDWSEIHQPIQIINSDVSLNKTIWVLWMQGMGKAPQLVQKCFATVEEFKSDYNVVLLTKENLAEYVRLPKHVEQLYQEGKMSEALHSDMIRLYLLINYGGIWRDATCYQTAPYPEYVKKSTFFMFSNTLLAGNISPIICSSWFIKSDNNNPLLLKTFNFLCEYHRHFSTPHNYYIFHLVLSVLVKNNEQCRRIWEKMPYVCNMDPHVFYFMWEREYTVDGYEHALSSCFIHKLSYKYSSHLTEKNNLLRHFLEA